MLSLDVRCVSESLTLCRPDHCIWPMTPQNLDKVRLLAVSQLMISEKFAYTKLTQGDFPFHVSTGGIQSEGDERQEGKRRGSVKPTVSQHWGLIWWDSAAEVCVYTVISTWSAAQPTETGGGWKSRPSSCQWKKEQNTKKAANSGKSRNVMSYVIITQGFVLVQVNKTACRAFFKCHCGKQTRENTELRQIWVSRSQFWLHAHFSWIWLFCVSTKKPVLHIS